MALLEVTNLGIQFGGLRAVDNFSMSIEAGELYGLIGPNGAGKTTIFNMLTGVYKPTEGKIFLDGKSIAGKKQIEINRLGIARTFQNIRLFRQMSVLDNVKVGLHNQIKYSTFSGVLKLPSYFKKEREMDARAMELLSVFGLHAGICEKLTVLNFGKVLASGETAEVLKNPEVITAYLGE